MRKRIEPVAKYTISCAGDILWFTFFFPLPPQILFISTVSRGWAYACPHRPPTVWRGVKNVGRTLGFPGSLIANAKVLVVSSSRILALKRKKNVQIALQDARRACLIFCRAELVKSFPVFRDWLTIRLCAPRFIPLPSREHHTASSLQGSWLHPVTSFCFIPILDIK